MTAKRPDLGQLALLPAMPATFFGLGRIFPSFLPYFPAFCPVRLPNARGSQVLAGQKIILPLIVNLCTPKKTVSLFLFNGT